MVFGHFRSVGSDDGKGGVVVRVVGILLDLLATLLFGVLSLLALAPEEETSENQEGDDYYRNDNSNGRLSTGAKAAVVV